MNGTSQSIKTPGIEWAQKTGGPWQTSSQETSGDEEFQKKVAMGELLRRSSLSSEHFILDSGLVQTWDKADPRNPYKCLPDFKTYLRYLIRWLNAKAKTATPKSRDMMATLLHCLWHLQVAMFRDGSEVVCISDKAEKAEHNLGRMLFSFLSMPARIRRMMPIQANKGTSGDPRIIRFLPRPPLWPGGEPFRGSLMVAIPSGSEQIQEYHPSHIFVDQVETIRLLKETMNAILPVVLVAERARELDPMAKVVHLKLVGTPHPGYWKDLVHDTLEAA